MNYLYLLLDIGVLFFPFVLSFDRKVAFYQKWKATFIAMLVVGIPFLIHDYVFTKMGIWGFNEEHLVGVNLGNLPLEEVLFFVVVPYACVFIYECAKHYLGSYSFERFNQFFYVVLSLYALTVLFFGWSNWYSSMASTAALVVLVYLYFKANNRYIPISFSLSMIPFFLMNSVLTGIATASPVVWYNNSENLAFRWGTIPVEDVLYSFVLIVSNILVMEWLSQKTKNKAVSKGI